MRSLTQPCARRGTRRLLAGAVACLLCWWTAPLGAQPTSGPIRLGLVTDMSGPSSANNGAGTVLGAKLAIADAGGMVLGRPVELLTADHLNKPDVGMSVVRRWVDTEEVGVILDTANSAIALAVQDLVRSRDRIAIYTGSLSSELTGRACSPNGFHWVIDTYSQTHAMVPTLLREGKKSWFFITADYAFGLQSERDATAAVVAGGGRVVGGARAPMPTDDFSAYLLQAAGSGAQVIGIANAVTDLINTVKQAHEFHVGQGSGQELATFYLMIRDVQSIGLPDTQGVLLADAFYWDQDDGTRAFSKRFYELAGYMPNELQAGMYSAVSHYLKAVKLAGTTDTQAVLKMMRDTPVEDFMTHRARIRADGRLMRDLYLFRVKAPGASKEPWDLYQQVARIPAEEAFRPASESTCPLLKTAGQ